MSEGQRDRDFERGVVAIRSLPVRFSDLCNERKRQEDTEILLIC